MYIGTHYILCSAQFLQRFRETLLYSVVGFIDYEWQDMASVSAPFQEELQLVIKMTGSVMRVAGAYDDQKSRFLHFSPQPFIQKPGSQVCFVQENRRAV